MCCSMALAPPLTLARWGGCKTRRLIRTHPQIAPGTVILPEHALDRHALRGREGGPRPGAGAAILAGGHPSPRGRGSRRGDRVGRCTRRGRCGPHGHQLPLGWTCERCSHGRVRPGSMGGLLCGGDWFLAPGRMGPPRMRRPAALLKGLEARDSPFPTFPCPQTHAGGHQTLLLSCSSSSWPGSCPTG